MLQKLKKQQSGFTIIEVLIVLAIAGLIMLIVFLAVPALQRSSRNTQRESDASKVAAALTACLSNRNGEVGSCATRANLEAAGGLDVGALQQLVTVNPGATFPAGTTTVNFDLGSTCSDDGSAINAGTERQGIVSYRVEGTGAQTQRCIET